MFTKTKMFAKNIVTRLTRKQWVKVVLAAVLLWSVTIIFIPHTINYSFTSQSCETQLILLPSISRSKTSTGFKILYRGGVRIGTYNVFSTQVCAVAVSAPKLGAYNIRSSAFGLLLPTLYRVRVPKAPSVLKVPIKTEVAITKPLEFTLDKSDAVHTYYLMIQSRIQKCLLSDSRLLCKLDKLGLAQGSEYTLTLARTFASEKPEQLATSRVTILPAVVVTAQSIQAGETIYSVPKEVTITTDKTLVSANASIVVIDGTDEKPIEAKIVLRGTTVALVFAADLPREKSFKVTLKSAKAATGTALAEPYQLSFITSGGPKVSGVNIGASVVATNATIRVSFDQALAAGQDIAKYVHIEGVSGAVTYSGSEVRIAITGATRCAAFSLKVAEGLRGENSLLGTSAWSYASRITCRSTSTVGYSVGGRPITAYYYGSGNTTILFVGGIHGSEASGSYILQDWIAHLDINGYKIPSGRQVVVVPQANPDGLAANSRDNAHGVNVDRNFPTSNWRTDINSANGFRATGGGPSAASEPETKALMSLTSQLRPRLEVSYHAQGSLVGASACSASPAIARSYASSVGYATMIGTAEETMGYELTGELEEWICEAYGTPAILIELPTRTGHYLSPHLNTMWQMVSY